MSRKKKTEAELVSHTSDLLEIGTLTVTLLIYSFCIKFFCTNLPILRQVLWR